MNGLPSWFTSIQLGDVVTFLLAFAALSAALWAMTRPFRRAAKGFEQFLEDWHGVPERPGFDAIPGIPERLRRLERNAREDRRRLEEIVHEIRPNSGGSLKDKVNKTTSDVDDVKRLVEARLSEITRLSADVAAVTRTLSNPRALRALAQRLDEDQDTIPAPRSE